MFQPALLFKLQKAKQVFEQNHPKFMPFLTAVANSGVTEGTVIEVKVTKPDGTQMESNIRLQQSDIEVLTDLASSMGKN